MQTNERGRERAVEQVPCCSVPTGMDTPFGKLSNILSIYMIGRSRGAVRYLGVLRHRSGPIVRDPQGV